jgi:hypothetical protein
MSDTAYDAGDQATVDNTAKEAARRDADDLETLRVWMDHPKGRDLLFRIIHQWCHLGEFFLAADDHGRTDEFRTALHLGERNIGARIDGKIREHTELYVKMLREQQLNEQVRKDRLAKREKEKKGDDGGQAGSQ